MDTTLLAAIIGAFATLGAAVISAAYGMLQGIEFRTLSRLPLYMVSIVGIATTAAGSIYLVLCDPTEARIRAALPDLTGYEQVVYARVGVGFLIPDHWQVDDASFRFGSGDIDLIKNIDPAAGSISQGIKLRLVNIQKTYVNNPEAAIDNQLAVWRVIDPDASVRSATFAGRPANRFAYKQVTGQRTAYIEQTWIRLTNRVKLHVISVSNLDSESRQIFERERDGILQAFVIDEDRLQELNELTSS